ncbi:MAG: ABC transporter permease [Arenicellaceae bacterium]|nr:ABC transporter permease [Arenicellaceae bacterium]
MPGLLGVILTLTLVVIIEMSMAQKVERGTMENSLAFPSEPHEVMLGKIAPYVAVGKAQTIVILTAATVLFGVPLVGSFSVLFFGISIFIIANLAMGFAFSTFAKSELQAKQMTFFFFYHHCCCPGLCSRIEGCRSGRRILVRICRSLTFCEWLAV